MKKFLSTLIVFVLLFCALPLFAGENSNNNPLALPRGVYYTDKTIYISLKYIDYNDFNAVFNRLNIFSYNKIVIDLFSFGGSVFDALAMVGVIEDRQREGKIIEIRARGIVASAGLIIMMSGTPGYRYLDRNCFVMFHEMWTFKYMAIETASDQEEQAKVMRKIQDAITTFITSKSKITFIQLKEMIKKKELWCDANEAITFGFADKIIGQETDKKVEQQKIK